MKITRRQLKRIIREEKARLDRRGLIQEMQEGKFDTGDAEFSSRAIDMGYNQSNLSRLYEKIKIFDMRMVNPEKCVSLLRPREEALFDDFMDVLDECHHPECKKLLDYAYEVQSYM